MTIKESKATVSAPPFDDNIPVAVAVEVPASLPVATPAQVPSITTTTTTTTKVVHLQALSSRPQPVTCPFCNASVVTRVREEISGCTIALVIILLLLFWPLFWLPLICKDVSERHDYAGFAHIYEWTARYHSNKSFGCCFPSFFIGNCKRAMAN